MLGEVGENRKTDLEGEIRDAICKGVSGDEDVFLWNTFKFCVRDHNPNDFKKQKGREC